MRHGQISNRGIPVIAIEWPALFRVVERKGRIDRLLRGTKKLEPAAAAAKFVRALLLNPDVGAVVIFGITNGKAEQAKAKIGSMLQNMMLQKLQLHIFESEAEEAIFFNRYGASFARIIAASKRTANCLDKEWFEIAEWVNTDDYAFILGKVG